MLVKRHNLFFPAVGHAHQRAVCTHHPDHTVRLLLVGELRDAAGSDMLGQDRHVWRLVGVRVDVADVLKFADLALAALQKQRHVRNLHRFDRGRAIV